MIASITYALPSSPFQANPPTETMTTIQYHAASMMNANAARIRTSGPRLAPVATSGAKRAEKNRRIFGLKIVRKLKEKTKRRAKQPFFFRLRRAKMMFSRRGHSTTEQILW